MLRLAAIAILLYASTADAIFFGNNNLQLFNLNNQFTRITCFGTEIATNPNSNLDQELDICVTGLVGGLILLIASFPFILHTYDNYGYGGYSYGGVLPYKRADNVPQVDPYKNPYENVENPEGYAAKVRRTPSVSERISKVFGNLRNSWRKRIGAAPQVQAAPAEEVQQEQQQKAQR